MTRTKNRIPIFLYPKPNTYNLVYGAWQCSTVGLVYFYFAGSADVDDDFHTYDDILEYDPEEDIIIPVGHMIQARWDHAVSVVPEEDYLQWCTFL